MEISVPCSVCTEISENSDIRSNQKGHRPDTPQLCEQKGIETIEAEVCPDHIHMLISFPSKYSISYVMGYLKEKSTLLRLTQAIGLASGFRLLF